MLLRIAAMTNDQIAMTNRELQTWLAIGAWSLVFFVARHDRRPSQFALAAAPTPHLLSTKVSHLKERPASLLPVLKLKQPLQRIKQRMERPMPRLVAKRYEWWVEHLRH